MSIKKNIHDIPEIIWNFNKSNRFVEWAHEEVSTNLYEW